MSAQFLVRPRILQKTPQMTTETNIRLALVISALRMLQDEGKAPPPGEVSPEYIARLSRELGEPVSADTIRRCESLAILKLKNKLKSNK